MQRILLVEDDARMANRVQHLLEGFGFAVDIAGRAAEARDLVASAPYRAVVLDWVLPDGEGPDVVRDFRARGIRLPVIMITGRSAVPDRVHALQSGADDYLVKPFDIRELAARVEALLRRTESEKTPDTLRCGPISVRVRAHEAWAEGERIELTYLEFRLLVFLMEAEGRAISRSEMLSTVWGIHHDGCSNVVDVSIARLRDKLGPAREAIETVRGFGYRLRVAIGPET